MAPPAAGATLCSAEARVGAGAHDPQRVRLERLRDSPRADHCQLAVLEAKLAAATVLPPEFAPENAVTLSSKVRTALIGAAAGDVVDCQAPLGVSSLRVEEVLFQPEAAGYFFV